MRESFQKQTLDIQIFLMQNIRGCGAGKKLNLLKDCLMSVSAYFINHVSPEILQTIFELRDSYMTKPKQDLINVYNKGQKNGFYGVQMQSLHFIALHLAFVDIFRLSPFTSVANCISFNQAIVLLDDGTWQFVKDSIHEN